jgi:hypothetical protein
MTTWGIAVNELKQVCEQLPAWGHVILWIGVFMWEHGLGKTKFGSTIGLFIYYVLRQKQPNEGEQK